MTRVHKENNPFWFVMRCRETEKLETLIEQYNADRETPPEDRVEEYFIPSLVVGQRVGIVFLYVRPSFFDRCNAPAAARYWKSGRVRLTFYRDGRGEAITVRPQLMKTFVNGCLEYLERLVVPARDAEIADGIEVTVRRGAFKDFKAEVYDVHYRANGICFSLAIKFFANDRYIHIHNLVPDDVKLAEQELPVFSDNLVDHLQTTLLDILRRRVYRKETDATRKADLRQLRQLYLLHHATIDDPLRAAIFDALMSICASLLGNSQEKGKYNRKIKQRLKELSCHDISGEEPARQEATAYLLTALYISTRDAAYRNELKTLVLQHLPNHKILREFLSLVRR